jgi:ribosomal-protein-alanine N-acetyltransferase
MLQLNFDPFPLLITPRLELRRLTGDDAEVLFRLRSDKRVMQFMDRPRPKSIDEVVELVHRFREDLIANRGINWAITIIGEGSLVGTIGLWKFWPENFRAEIGYLLDPAFQGKGIMNEALGKVIDFGFNELHLHSIVAEVNPSNASSIKLLERNHFVREGYFRENYYYNGKFIDTAIYALVDR